MKKLKEKYMITMNDIVQEGDPILRTKVEEVDLPLNDEVKEELECMMQYLRNSQDPEMAEKYQLRPGVGLAANQVGLNKRIFVVLFDDEKGNHYEYKFVNPKVKSHSTNIVFVPQGEGCLSVSREVKGHVPRYDRIKFEAYNEKGEKDIYSFKGFPAIVMQHEIDHLNGVMFFDHINEESPFINIEEKKRH